MRIDLEKLRAKNVASRDLREALAIEKNSCEILTLPTLGLFDAEFSKREAEGRAKLDRREVEAQHNVTVLETLLAERGIGADLSVCQECGKYFVGLYSTSDVCRYCYMPDDNY